MATRSVATTDSLNTLRTTVNAISGTDIGDLATLGTSAKSSIVAAVNEINTSVTGTGFTISDGTTTQSVVTGNTITFTGSTGIAAAVSATDTLTISLNNEIPENIFADVLGAQHNADGSNAYTELVVTVATKDGNHIYEGSGSSNGYKIDGIFAPFIQFEPGNTYRFNQQDGTNGGHPLAFYLDAAKNTAYTTGVTTSGTAGSSNAYTQIVVSDATPQRLYYQCTNHAFMGNMARTSSTAFADTTSSAILTITGGSITDSSGAISFGNENLSTSGTLTLSSLSAASSDTDAFIVSDSGVLKTRTGAQVASDIGAATNAFAIAQAVALG